MCSHKAAFRVQTNMRTVNGVDQIIVLKDGVVAEQGTPSVLKEKARSVVGKNHVAGFCYRCKILEAHIKLC